MNDFENLTFLPPGVTKIEYLLTIPIQFWAEKCWEERNINKSMLFALKPIF